MPNTHDSHSSDVESIQEFLKTVMPFKELDPDTLSDLASEITVDFFPKGTVIQEQGVTDPNYFYLIRTGAVRVYFTDESGHVVLLDVRGDGGHFGAVGLIRGSRSGFSVETEEDTFCLLLPKEAFLELLRTHPKFSQFYLKRFSEDLVDTAYGELRTGRVKERPQDAFYLFSMSVQDAIKRSLEIIHTGESVRDAAIKMSNLGIGCLLVQDVSGEITGIITDRDLRTKVVAEGLNYSTPVGEVMSSPVHAIPAHSVCFDALLHMMNKQVHHLAVRKRDEIIGVITSHDIMVHQGSSPLYLLREIAAEHKVEGLKALSSRVPGVVRSLVEEGAKANNITRMITVINDRIVERVLSLLCEETGPAPYPFCWITFGSEGRKEQTFKTDQDNALIYETPPEDWDAIKQGKLFFRRFGNKAIEYLEKCGYPLCPGQMMASNPRWRKPYAVWRNYFDKWIAAPEPQEVLHATIFFDFRPVFGDIRLGDDLRRHLTREAPHKGIFLMHLAKECLTGRPPLTFFRNFIVEKDGEHKNRLDLKTRGLVPFVNFARLLSLKHGVQETNTLGRLSALAEGDCIPRELYNDTRDAYEFQMQLRLVHQLRMIESKRQPDNYIDPTELSDLEKQTLREAFAVVGRIQMYVKDEFRVVE